METLRIQNFAGITDGEIELRDFNLFIGPQAAGKSVTVKLVFYFREAVNRLIDAVVNERRKVDLRKDDEQLFLEYFPPSTWRKGDFSIGYAHSDFGITVERKGPGNVKLIYSNPKSA